VKKLVESLRVLENKFCINVPEDLEARIDYHHELLTIFIHRIQDWLFEDLDTKPHNRDQGKSYLRIMWALSNLNNLPRHVDTEEGKKIRLLKEGGYSNSELAYIFQRSKSTIHDVLHRDIEVTNR
jgi:hypothetical protein